ncbi:MAG: bifunctional phosphopantothenoylcysteine decarboxylase/phosphopantothenate--cysteine ligase CoaBC [Chloroflexota bacterium]
MNIPFQGKHVLLGVTGSIAAYKAAALASKLAQAEAMVDVILTPAATEFVTPLTFQSVTGRRAYVDADLWGGEGHVLHVGLAHAANLLVIAPITANTLAKLAHGQADNLLTVTALAARCPLILAPAMDGGMFTHPATQANIQTLRERGAILAGPVEGHLASGRISVGRMVEPDEIFGHIRLVLGRGGSLAGKKVVVTAGGTQEPIDLVRVIANRSSGKQGYALAQAALDLGAEVTLIVAPVHLPTPVGAKKVEVLTAGEMLAAVMQTTIDADVLLMAAAVADFRPVEPAKGKLKRRDGIPQIKLEAAPDILEAVSKRKSETGFPRITIGFAAESHDLVENAREKLGSKCLDMVVANDISASDSGFAVDTNRVTLLFPDGGVEALPLMSKMEVARRVLAVVVDLLKG